MFFSGFSVKPWKIKSRVMGHSCVLPLRPSIGHQLSWLRNGDHSSIPLFTLKGKSVHLIEKQCLATIFSHSLSVGGLDLIKKYCPIITFCPSLSCYEKPLKTIQGFWTLDKKRYGRRVFAAWLGGYADEVISSFQLEILKEYPRKGRQCWLVFLYCYGFVPRFAGRDQCL